MAETMVERVAMSIHYAGFHPSDVANGAALKKWDEWGDSHRRKMVTLARAAMDATADFLEGVPAGSVSEDLAWGSLIDIIRNAALTEIGEKTSG